MAKRRWFRFSQEQADLKYSRKTPVMVYRDWGDHPQVHIEHKPSMRI